jgi:hypothetical protein
MYLLCFLVIIDHRPSLLLYLPVDLLLKADYVFISINTKKVSLQNYE